MMLTKPTIFFSNPKISSEALLCPHMERTVARINNTDSEYILSISDTTTLNFTSHKAKTEIGRIGRCGKTELYGLFQHSVMCVSAKNECLGLIDIQYFHNDDFDTEADRHERPIEEKKTICWINGIRAQREALKGNTKKIIHITDREGDFFEFLHEFYQHNESFIIRAQHNRHTGEKKKHIRHYKPEEKLFALLEQKPAVGFITTTINDVKTHQKKTIQLTVKRLQKIKLPPPDCGKNGIKTKDYNEITVNVVQVYNQDYCWILYTDLPVETLQNCEFIINCYKERWHIEDYHKVLKTAYQIDEIYLHSSREAIENVLTMIAISACRLYWMIYTGRAEEGILASALFEEHEWQTAYIYFQETPPIQPPPLNEVIIRIARFGGYKPNKKAGPPGIKTMWIGFQLFNAAAKMYEHILSRKT